MIKRCFSRKESLIIHDVKYLSNALSKPFKIKPEKEWNVEDSLFDKEWCSILKDEFRKNYFIEINKKLKEDYKKQHTIFPSKYLIFHALNLTQLSKVIIFIV